MNYLHWNIVSPENRLPMTISSRLLW